MGETGSMRDKVEKTRHLTLWAGKGGDRGQAGRPDNLTPSPLCLSMEMTPLGKTALYFCLFGLCICGLPHPSPFFLQENSWQGTGIQPSSLPLLSG